MVFPYIPTWNIDPCEVKGHKFGFKSQAEHMIEIVNMLQVHQSLLLANQMQTALKGIHFLEIIWLD